MIDDRAGSSQLAHLIPGSHLVRLPSADVAFPGHGPDGEVLVGVEVKSVQELVSAIQSGRLQGTQVPGMLGDYDVVWVAYYGLYRRGGEGELEMWRGGEWRAWSIGKRPVPWSYVESFLMTLAASGVRVKHAHSLKELAHWVHLLARWWGKAWGKHRGLCGFDNSRVPTLMPGMDEREHMRAKMAMCLPGVGYERARAVAAHFPSVEEMVGATEGEWEEVVGVGKVVARAVKEAMK